VGSRNYGITESQDHGGWNYGVMELLDDGIPGRRPGLLETAFQAAQRSYRPEGLVLVAQANGLGAFFGVVL
jgi:hypothetical protein